MIGPKGTEQSEFSASINVARLPQDGLPIRIDADATECERVAKRLGLLGMAEFSADLVASRWQKDGVRVHGTLKASVVQTDVVSLDPLEASVAEAVELFFVPEGSPLARALEATGDDEIEIDPVDETPDVFRGDRIDLGDALIQLLGLAIDPYPRKAGIEFEERREGEKEPSPFAVLAKLRGENR